MVWKAFQKQRMGAKCVVVHEACGYFEEDKNREAVMVAFKAQKRLGWFPKVRTLE